MIKYNPLAFTPTCPEICINTDMKVRETYIDSYSPLHAVKQGMKIEVGDFGLVHPFRFGIVDFHTNPYPSHVFHTWQQAGDEV